MTRVGLVLPDQLSGFTPTETIDIASLADRHGFSTVWKGESSENNGLLILAAIATQTESVRLGSGVANVFTRTPTLLGMSANTLNQLSDGRYILGMGTSSKPVVENWHGITYERALRRLRETIEIVRELFAEDTIEYDGEIFDVGPYSSNFLASENEPPIYNAAMGETNRQLTGEFADGWFPLFAPRSSLPEYTEAINEAAASAGRDDLDVVPWIPAAVDDDPAAAEDRIRHMLAQEFAMGYNRVMSEYGYGENADAVHDAWRNGDREEAKATISDEILDEFTIFGTPATCRDQIAAFQEAGATEPTLWPSFSAGTSQVEHLVRTLGPDG